jgi:uncharacterized protein YegL
MKSRIYPFYIAIDNSASMRNEINGVTRAELAMKIPMSLLELYASDPALSSPLRVSVLEFNIEAKTLLPLSAIPMLRNLPQNLNPGYRTYFSNLFTELKVRIAEDLERYSKTSIVMKPAVLIVTDGIPSDSPEAREKAYEELGLRVGGERVENFEGVAPQVLVLGVGMEDFSRVEIYDTTLKKEGKKIRRASNYQEVSDHLNAISVWLRTHVSQSLAKPNLDPAQDWFNDEDNPDFDDPWEY